MKSKVLLAAGIVVSALVAGFYYTTTPTYSVLQIHQAIKEHDVPMFEKYVDMDTLYGRLLDDIVTQQMGATMGRESEGLAQLGQALSLGMMQMFKPALLEGFKTTTIRYVETGELMNDVRPGAADSTTGNVGGIGKTSLGGLTKKLGLSKDEDFKYEIERQGKTALVKVPMRQADLDMPIELQFTLRDQGTYWQLVHFKNAAELMSQIDARKEAIRDAEIKARQEKHAEELAQAQKNIQGEPSDDLQWSVQVASLSSKDAADSLEQRLRRAGCDTYQVEAGGINRVFCGPMTGRNIADAKRTMLNSSERLMGFVVRYHPR